MKRNCLTLTAFIKVCVCVCYLDKNAVEIIIKTLKKTKHQFFFLMKKPLTFCVLSL